MSFFKISSISSLIFDCELKLTVLIIIIFFRGDLIYFFFETHVALFQGQLLIPLVSCIAMLMLKTILTASISCGLQKGFFSQFNRGYCTEEQWQISGRYGRVQTCSNLFFEVSFHLINQVFFSLKINSFQNLQRKEENVQFHA